MGGCGLEDILRGRWISRRKFLLGSAQAALMAGGLSEFSCDPRKFTPSTLDTETRTFLIEPSEYVRLYAHYGLWFTKGSCAPGPENLWLHWSALRDGKVWKDDPCIRVRGAPYLREISSAYYPIIGPYDSSEPDVMRWHMQTAKAAGIDGFFVALYTWADPDFDWRGRFRQMLDIANEEYFSLAIEGWLPEKDSDTSAEPEPVDLGQWQSEIQSHLDEFGNDPAYLQIDSRPAYWINNPRKYMDYPEIDEERSLKNFLASRNATWILSYSGMTDEEVMELNAFLQSQPTDSRAQHMSHYHVPTTHGFELKEGFAQSLFHKGSAPENGLIPIAHGYPGFDEIRIADRYNRPRRFGDRNHGETLRELLEKARINQAQIVILESFNDFIEGHHLEPGMDVNFIPTRDFGQEPIYYVDVRDGGLGPYVQDPYTYLKVIADFKKNLPENRGNEGWPENPPMPPCGIIDEYMLDAPPEFTINPSCSAP